MTPVKILPKKIVISDNKIKAITKMMPSMPKLDKQYSTAFRYHQQLLKTPRKPAKKGLNVISKGPLPKKDSKKKYKQSSKMTFI